MKLEVGKTYHRDNADWSDAAAALVQGDRVECWETPDESGYQRGMRRTITYGVVLPWYGIDQVTVLSLAPREPGARLVASVRDAQADAWDEAQSAMRDCCGCAGTPNPYREDGDHDTARSKAVKEDY